MNKLITALLVLMFMAFLFTFALVERLERQRDEAMDLARTAIAASKKLESQARKSLAGWQKTQAELEKCIDRGAPWDR